jgi:DNA invertase Pin-like site-specific DNA recombinase
MTKVKESIRTPRPARTRKPSKGQQVGYLRVSSLDQNEVRQLEGLALDKKFTDKASGKDAKRPQLGVMQSFVREGDTVFCHSMDRLARNLDDLRRIVLLVWRSGARRMAVVSRVRNRFSTYLSDLK